jgi:hypothetical protein
LGLVNEIRLYYDARSKKHQHKELIRHTSGAVKYYWFYGRNKGRTYIIFSVYEYSIEIYDMRLK